MKRLLVIVTLLLSCAAAVAHDVEFRCLVSTGTKKPIRLKFVFPPDNSNTGSVIYQGGSGAIKVTRKRERTVHEAPNGRPWDFESVWKEVTPDGEGGTYFMETQGALIDDFKYVRKKDGKVFHFEDEPDAHDDDDGVCAWEKRRERGGKN